MDAGPRTSWTHNEPTIRWSSFFACITEKIVLEVFWNAVVFEKPLSFGMLAVVRIEYIQWGVVLGRSLECSNFSLGEPWSHSCTACSTWPSSSLNIFDMGWGGCFLFWRQIRSRQDARSSLSHRHLRRTWISDCDTFYLSWMKLGQDMGAPF